MAQSKSFVFHFRSFYIILKPIKIDPAIETLERRFQSRSFRQLWPAVRWSLSASQVQNVRN